MSDSVTLQDLVQLENDYLNQIREINTHHRKERKDLQFEIANLRDRLTQNDRQWNKTIDAHEVTKQRLLGYENEAGVPKSASEREAYMSYNPK